MKTTKKTHTWRVKSHLGWEKTRRPGVRWVPLLGHGKMFSNFIKTDERVEWTTTWEFQRRTGHELAKPVKETVLSANLGWTYQLTKKVSFKSKGSTKYFMNHINRGFDYRIYSAEASVVIKI